MLQSTVDCEVWPVPFTDFGIMAVVGLLMGVVTIRTVYQTIKNRQNLFDQNFTRADRQHMSVASFFILVPISVFFHEVGHAVAIWWYGGEITAFGYFLFFGFVGYRGIADPTELFWIALWGNIVSVAMGIGALLWVFLRPMRHAVNYLLIMFGIISILISLVFYPLTDFLSDLHGDWSQIYSWDTAELSIGTGIVHALIVLGLIGGWQSNRVRLRFAELTGLRPEEIRRVGRKDAEREVLEAATTAATKFSGLARAEAAGSSRDAVAVNIQWTSGGFHRTLSVIAILTGQMRVELFGSVRALDGTDDAGQQLVMRVRGVPEPEKLSPNIVRSLQVVDKMSLARDRGNAQG
jgi:hypothetical protein